MPTAHPQEPKELMCGQRPQHEVYIHTYQAPCSQHAQLSPSPLPLSPSVPWPSYRHQKLWSRLRSCHTIGGSVCGQKPCRVVWQGGEPRRRSRRGLQRRRGRARAAAARRTTFPSCSHRAFFYPNHCMLNTFDMHNAHCSTGARCSHTRLNSRKVRRTEWPAGQRATSEWPTSDAGSDAGWLAGPLALGPPLALAIIPLLAVRYAYPLAMHNALHGQRYA